MHTDLSELSMISMADLDSALSLLEKEPGEWCIIAGGTDIMVQIHEGNPGFKQFLDISALAELKNIEKSDSEVRVGALVTFDQIQDSEILQTEFPNLCSAAALTGSVAIQNRGTFGGNIANASPAADLPPALLVYDAEIELVSRKNRRRIPYREFHLDYKVVDMEPDEIIHSMLLKRHRKISHHFYRKVGTRKAQAISKIVIAGSAQLDGNKIEAIRIAFGSVAPVPKRCTNIEAFLSGKTLSDETISRALAMLDDVISPIDDIRSNAQFRARVSRNVLGEFLESLVKQSAT